MAPFCAAAYSFYPQPHILTSKTFPSPPLPVSPHLPAVTDQKLTMLVNRNGSPDHPVRYYLHFLLFCIVLIRNHVAGRTLSDPNRDRYSIRRSQNWYGVYVSLPMMMMEAKWKIALKIVEGLKKRQIFWWSTVTEAGKRDTRVDDWIVD